MTALPVESTWGAGYLSMFQNHRISVWCGGLRLMMKQMRENTKWIMLIVAIAFVALMVFDWGMDVTGRSGSQLTGEIGRVNGEAVPYEEFNAVYRTLYDQQQTAVVGPLGEAMQRQIEDAAWERVITQRLIAQELKARGIVVTNDEILQAARYEPPPELRTNPLFLTDGQFDIDKYHQFMANPAVDTELLIELERFYREQIPRSKLFFQQTAGVYVTDDELWQIWRDTRDSVTARFVAFDPQALVPDEAITLSDGEIDAWYREHREDYIRPARARVKYVMLDRRPNAADSAAALARVQQVRAELAGGADFAAVAQRESADSASAVNGGLLTIRKDQTYPAFDQAAFSQPLNQLGLPILAPSGHHIVKVERRWASDSASVRHILIPIELTSEHEDQLLDHADSLDVLTETFKLDRIGQALGLQVQETELIPGLGFVPGIGEAADGTEWAFRTANPGDVSTVYETPSTYYVFELISKDEERTLTRAEATESIRAGLSVRKKIDRTKERARQAVDRIRGGQSFEAVAAALNLEVQSPAPFTRADFVPGLGRMNGAIGTAFGLRPGQTSGAVEANQSVYIIHLVSRKDADRAAWEQQRETQRQQVIQVLAQQRWESYLAAIREDARIIDNREAILRPAVTPVNPLGT